MHMYRISIRTWTKLIVALVFLINISVCGGGPFDDKPIDNHTKKYDILFNKASKRYFGVGFDYR